MKDDFRRYYLEQVYPRLNLPMAQRYPFARLQAAADHHALGDHSLLMLVALTGTGKSTTLEALKRRTGGAGMSLIPTRRELADWVALPLMQALAREPLAAVTDRVARFAYTREFARRVSGGMAAVFSWLYLHDDCQPALFTEGIRGGEEIEFALTHFPKWRIVELSLHPLTRLKRLSRRLDAFDQAAGACDLAFLPLALRDEAHSLLQAEEISQSALAIMAAEARNYGLHPFAAGARFANYHCIAADDLSPDEIADLVLTLAAKG